METVIAREQNDKSGMAGNGVDRIANMQLACPGNIDGAKGPPQRGYGVDKEHYSLPFIFSFTQLTVMSLARLQLAEGLVCLSVDARVLVAWLDGLPGLTRR
ncbi:hypothetical protein PoB_006114200 [Plakobranchus ocellatus]|uniref:Uncharacterized protein n=1 Tax=Plakobranchus ocellatus TaxID=259542 RepID=A0AAV4CRX7_9GAST|nr:hypothetical protein PoB_006114200 [Plakobranchus ocellatus]